MAEASFTFPNNFLWGTATSSHQVEGNNTNNNWYAWENDGNTISGEKSELACDWWQGRWKEDFDRAAESGQNSHRFSIEWSRIQPAPNRFDFDALDHYRQMAKALVDNGITPMVTLHHFTDPLWLVEMRGWENDFVVDHFNDYTRKVVSAIGDYVDIWCTINEPNVFAISSYILGDFPPGKISIKSAYKVIRNLINAHVLSYHTIHEIQPEAKVGLAHQYRGFTPANPNSPFDRWITGLFSSNFNDTFPETFHSGIWKFLGKKTSIPEAKGTQDFFGINYYTRDFLKFSPFSPKEIFVNRYIDPQKEQSTTGFIANEPDVFFEGLKWATLYNLPIYITENGIEDAEDDLRPKFIVQHLHKVWQGINFNWPIKGYYHWTLVDNFEWERGWSQRFGLWELDIKTQERRKRKSASLYEKICKENALTSEIVSAFIPELLDTIFPG